MASLPLNLGLLEQPCLLAPLGVGSLTTQEGLQVGTVRKLGGGLEAWLRGPSYAVHESEEEPLVFTMRRTWPWWPRWQVHDGCSTYVGSVGGSWILGRWGERWIQRAPDGAFLTIGGVALGRLRGRALHFEPSSEGEPFARMLLLASAIAR